MKQKIGEATLIEPWEWTRADLRLDFMEEQARKAIDGRWAMTRIAVKQYDPLSLEKLGLLPATSMIEVPPTAQGLGLIVPGRE